MSQEFILKNHSLDGKVAVVTGASRGIGAAIALELGKKGASVILTYTSASSEALAAKVLDEIKASGSSGTTIKADMSNLEEVKNLAKRALEFSENKVDIIVNNAGVSMNAMLGDIDLDHYQKQYDVNVRGPLFLTQHLLPHIQPGGRIVNISSVSARGGFAAQTVYGATKAALEAMTRSWANEFAQSKQITVNAINPGPVESDMWNAAGEAIHATVKKMVAGTPSGNRIGQPNDIAKIVGFLAEEGSTWVNGNVLCGNGGLMML